MKRVFLSLTAMVLAIMAWADAPTGYALFGGLPAGFVDLRDYVEVCNDVTVNNEKVQSSSSFSLMSAIPYSFSGKADCLDQTHFNQRYVACAIRFSGNKSLSLTGDMKIHIVMRRKNAGTNKMQISFCKTVWSDARLGFEVAGNQITNVYKDIVLDTDNRVAANYNCHNPEAFVGENLEFQGGVFGVESRDLFRISAAADEAFEISMIYITTGVVNPCNNCFQVEF